MYKSQLVERIRAVAKYKKHIKVYNKEIVSFIESVLPNYGQNSMTYFDPPYFNKGPELYKNFFDKEDHAKIAQLILNGVPGNWIITYDDTPEIIELYKQQCICLLYTSKRTMKSVQITALYV